jgi:site-specific DNA-methyltransferase (adenine-specific)
MSARILAGDCRLRLREIASRSVHAVVCDPPYDLVSGRGASGGFMGAKWDATGVAFNPETWRAVLRTLRPGGHLLAFGGTRTYHRLAAAIEDAGFEIRGEGRAFVGIERDAGYVEIARARIAHAVATANTKPVS